MIDIKDISKSYGNKDLFNNASLRISPLERIGIVGPNGAGKSTLFNIIDGTLTPDKGSVSKAKNLRIGLLHQQLLNVDKECTLLDFTADAIEELKDISSKLHELEDRLNKEIISPEEKKKLLDQHGYLQTKAEHLGLYTLRPTAEQVLCSLGFDANSLTRPFKSFSGGWQMRAALARVLISKPDILMLDEPSNYLDIPAIEWLCKFLKSFSGTLLLISHDRYLLRRLANIIVEINGGKISRYSGGYDYYCNEREQRKKNLESAKRNSDRKKEQMERLIDRFRAKSSKATQAKSWQKALDKMEDIVLPDELNYSGCIRFPKPPPMGAEAVRIENLSFSYSENKKIFDSISLSLDNGERVAFVGFNGSGKTTLLKLIANRLKPNSGNIILGHNSILGYQAQEFSDLLIPEQTVYDTVKAALPAGAKTSDLMSVLGSFGFPGEGSLKTCSVLSGGEKIRLLFARIFVNPPNFLLLDEPTTHLDINARELLQKALNEYKGTVCVVSHDIEFVRNVATNIVAMETPKIRRYFGNYDYYLEKLSANNKTENSEITTSKKSVEIIDNSKERRRARAQARGGLSAAKRNAENAVKSSELKLEELENRQNELTEMLSTSTGIDVVSIGRELDEIQKQISITMENWEKASLELEEIQKENQLIHQ